jgi:hypothetical protein
MARCLLCVLVTVGCVALFLLGVAALGRAARQQLRGHERYTVAFAAIDCEPPPGQDRADFLDEVQYLGGLPDQLSLLEPGLGPRLAVAFALHPRVESVERVTLAPGGRVHVRLRHRPPPSEPTFGDPPCDCSPTSSSP